jgi:hypothetical protein
VTARFADLHHALESSDVLTRRLSSTVSPGYGLSMRFRMEWLHLVKTVAYQSSDYEYRVDILGKGPIEAEIKCVYS